MEVRSKLAWEETRKQNKTNHSSTIEMYNLNLLMV